MKKKSVFICTLILLAIFMFGCSGTANEIEEKEQEIVENTIEDTTEDEVEEEIVVNEIEHKIVFIINKQQFNDHYHNEGFFIDNMGNKCHFDLSKETDDYANEEKLYKYLNEHAEEYEKEPFLEKEQLYECYKHLLMIDKNAEKVEENVMVDYGYVRFFGIRPCENGKEEIILLEEFGDWEVTNLDENVDDIMEILGRNNWVKEILERRK